MISKTINISDKTKAFYYDEQLTNKMTLVSLHASTEPGPPPKYSKAWSGKKLDDDGFYGEDPICKSVIAEDFTVSINNTFSEFGGDAIGQAWTSFVQPLAPYVGAVGNDIEKIAQKAAGLANDLASKSEYEFVKTGAKGIQKIADYITGKDANDGLTATQRLQSVMSRKLIVQGTMFSYYGGTGIDFGNLSMKFNVFSGYDENGSYKTVKEQVDKFMWYVMGDFKPVTEIGDVGKQFANWQIAPGGYMSEIRDIDQCQWGTLKLLVGPYFAVEGLVIKGAQLQYSKALAKNPNVGDTTQLEPLCCEVTLLLAPASKSSAERLKRFAYGNASLQYRQKFEKEVAGSLSVLKSINNDLGIDKM